MENDQNMTIFLDQIVNRLDMISADSFIAIGIAGVTALFFYLQYRRKVKIDSIEFTLIYVEKMLNKKNNRNVINKLYDKHDDKKTVSFSDDEIKWFLNDFENVLLIKKKKIISKNDIVYQFSIDLLKWMRDDNRFKSVIRCSRKKNNDYKLYEESIKFLNKL